FWDDMEKCWSNIVSVSGKRDNTPSSRCVVALSLLLDEKILSQHELTAFLDRVQENLIVTRQGLPFGVLVRKSQKRIYYNDEEYHEAMVWPRDTPYLIRLFEAMGLEEEIEGLFRSNLEHQMEEGVVFYNSELFSPDDGEMTPVKNPAQLWSQWVDPFLRKNISYLPRDR
ncbi:MAG: glucosidase family protein, partial [Candidatus Methanospirareceae archaeon]